MKSKQRGFTSYFQSYGLKQDSINYGLQAKCSLPPVLVWPHQQRTLFTLFNCWKKIFKNHILWDKKYEFQIWVSPIKIYWDTVTHIHLHIVYGCFHTITAELKSCDRPYGLWSLKYLLSGPSTHIFIYPLGKVNWMIIPNHCVCMNYNINIPINVAFL